MVDPKVITFFDRDDKESLLRIVGELGTEMKERGKSVMVHVEGTRSLSCRPPVEKMSGAFLDLAIAVGCPVVPVRFVGALPVAPLDKRIEFPIGMGQQDLWFGAPIEPDALKAVGAAWNDRAVADSLPTFDWEAVAKLLDSVRAL